MTSPLLCPTCCLRERDPGRLVCGPCAAEKDYRVLDAPEPADVPVLVVDPDIVPKGVAVADGTPDPFGAAPDLLVAAKAVLRAWLRRDPLCRMDHAGYIDLAAAIDAEEARRDA